MYIKIIIDIYFNDLYRYEEDEQLAKAIAASLNEDQPKPKPKGSITVRACSAHITAVGIYILKCIDFHAIYILGGDFILTIDLVVDD